LRGFSCLFTIQVGNRDDAELREGFAIIDRALAITDRAVE